MIKAFKYLKKYFLQAVLVLILCLYFLCISKNLLFYDAPEYINIVSFNSFFKSISMGHQPIHPVFLADLWIFTHILNSVFKLPFEYGGNFYAFANFLASVYIFWLISKKLLKASLRSYAVLVFILFPALLVTGTNLMVESLLLPLYLALIYLMILYFKDRLTENLFILSTISFLILGTHIEGAIWIISALVFVSLFYKISKGTFGRVIGFVFILPLIFSILFYYFVQGSLSPISLLQPYKVISPQILGPGGLIFILRGVRNSLLILISGFGTLFFLLTMIYMFMVRRKAKSVLLLILLFTLTLLAGSHWVGDFMIRRLLFLSVFLVFFGVLTLKKKSWILVIYLAPIFFANIILYIGTKPSTLPRMASMQSDLNGTLIQTHYVRPFTKCGGGCVWVGEDNLDNINQLIIRNKNVYLDSQVLFAPYMIYTGENIHITSLGKYGHSEGKGIFGRYYLDLVSVGDSKKRVFAYKVSGVRSGSNKSRMEKSSVLIDDGTKLIYGTAKPESLILIYSNNFWSRLSRERINYADIFVWLWALLSNRQEPLGWTYADKSGYFIYPVNSELINSVRVTHN